VRTLRSAREESPDAHSVAGAKQDNKKGGVEKDRPSNPPTYPGFFRWALEHGCVHYYYPLSLKSA
jgi:hypothetical protein